MNGEFPDWNMIDPDPDDWEKNLAHLGRKKGMEPINSTVVGYPSRCSNVVNGTPCGNILTIIDTGRCSECRRNSVRRRGNPPVNPWRK